MYLALCEDIGYVINDNATHSCTEFKMCGDVTCKRTFAKCSRIFVKCSWTFANSLQSWGKFFASYRRSCVVKPYYTGTWSLFHWIKFLQLSNDLRKLWNFSTSNNLVLQVSVFIQSKWCNGTYSMQADCKLWMCQISFLCLKKEHRITDEIY